MQKASEGKISKTASRSEFFMATAAALVASSLMSFFATALSNAYAASSPATCTRLQFIPVEPEFKRDWTSPCSSEQRSRDKGGCDKKDALAKIHSTDGAKRFSPVHRIALDPGFTSQFLKPLESSPAIREVGAMRIRSREISDLERCAPILVYFGTQEKLAGVGPAFFDGERFIFEGKQSNDFMAIEDAVIMHKSLLTKKGLIQGGYYDLTVAHELAHGLMQDLYGIENLANLEQKIVSGDHYASAVSDPHLAWLEGFAEGFEAYLGEKYMTPADRQHPVMDWFFMSLRDDQAQYDKNLKQKMLDGPFGLLFTAKGFWQNIDAFFVDFLKDERQAPIRENLFVTRGLFVNLTKQYPNAIMDASDIDAHAQYLPETLQAVYAKEGVVAHIVYTILKAGLRERMFQVLHRYRPETIRDFAMDFLKDATPEERAKVEPSLKAVFTEAGRKATTEYLSWVDADPKRRVDARKDLLDTLASIKLPSELPLINEGFWLEYESVAKMQRTLQGTRARINLLIAPNLNLKQFFHAAVPEQKFDDPQDDTLISITRRIREALPENATLSQFLSEWDREAHAQMFKGGNRNLIPFLMDRIGSKFRESRGCFKTRCMSY